MSRPTKLAELNWITPYLAVQDVKKAIEFYTDIFGFTVHEALRDKNEKIVFARIRYKETNIILSPHVAFEHEHPGFAPIVTKTISPVVLCVYCDDLDKRYRKARDYGLEILMPLGTRFWGDAMFRVADPEGYFWDFATHVADFNPQLLPPELRD